MSGRNRGRLSAVVVAVAMVLFLLPLACAAAFGFTLPGRGVTLAPLTDAVDPAGLLGPVLTSLLLAALTMLASLCLLVPTLLLMHLRLRRLLPIAEAATMIAFVVPPIALVSGVNVTFRAIAPSFLVHELSLVPFYVVLSMPLVYRALDAGIRAVDIATLVAAGRSLGASIPRVVVEIVLPNLRSALVAAGLLAATMALGEFVFASLLLHNTFPVFLSQTGNVSARPAAAMSLITLVVTWSLMAVLTRAAGSVGRARTPRPRALIPVPLPAAAGSKDPA